MSNFDPWFCLSPIDGLEQLFEELYSYGRFQDWVGVSSLTQDIGILDLPTSRHLTTSLPSSVLYPITSLCDCHLRARFYF